MCAHMLSSFQAITKQSTIHTANEVSQETTLLFAQFLYQSCSPQHTTNEVGV